MTKSANILIIDDTPANVELVHMLLEDAGYTSVHGEIDSRNAQALIKSMLPDLILLDIRMPHINGLELMQWMKNEFGHKAPSVIVLTAQIDETTRREALSLGAQDFLTKPFDHSEVLQRIHNTLQMALLLKEGSKRAESLEKLVNSRTEDLALISRQDPVTELPNRRRLLEELMSYRKRKEFVSVLYLYMDGIEEISSLHGYAVTDKILRKLSTELTHHPLLKPYMLGVWNSQEWVMLCAGCISQQEVENASEAICKMYEQRIYVDQMSFQLQVRIGICSGSASRMPEQLIRKAALALPKELSSWQFYSSELEAIIFRRAEIRSALQEAVQNNEFYLLYQPKVETVSGNIVGAEVLMRWESPAFGFVSPVEFIPLLESTGAIVPVGEWVIRQSIQKIKEWQQQGIVDEQFSLAVNVSSIQLMDSGFANRVMKMIRSSELAPSCLEIEVTESSLMKDINLALSQLKQLSMDGVRIAMDDFGTGYSSLAYLKSLPISVLKIDREFIKQIHQNPIDHKLTEAVVEIGNFMEFITVAEGVELFEQFSALKEMGCDLIQGFMFSPPLKEAALLNLLQQPTPFSKLIQSTD
ncbi:GGDEF domain-containing response regulator [Vibrio viridaestus]|uniref:GGDEF domain-containing response regulator n=1 Tax=Vibrio viridaestus TaxID=2487322 RepID=A0A3N9TC55_9VIBR|nr:GGDEF domain-containing response regulator [Vibrio viridaestus]